MKGDALEDLLGEALSGLQGWDGLDKLGTDFKQKNIEQNSEMRRLAEAEAATAAAVFNTPEGRKFLILLLRKTLLRPPTEEQRTSRSMEGVAILGLKRQGQNEITQMILDMLDVARGMSDKQGGDLP